MNEHFTLSPLADELEPALRAILTQSFQFAAWEVYRARVGRESFRALTRDGRVVAGLAMYRMGQWFGGRVVPMTGFAAVGVAPEHRGTGVGRELMARALREQRDAGVPIAALYASTQALYRKVGFEQAGSRVRYAVEARRIGEMSDRSLPCVPVEAARHELFHDLYRRFAERQTGLLDRNRAIWERAVLPPDAVARAYLVGPEAAPEGYVVFTQDRGKSFAYDLAVRDLCALTPAAARRLWTFFADHRSLAGEITWSGPPVEPLLALLPEQPARVTGTERWLVRILDVKEALARRGWPTGVEAELHLDVRDELLRENHGRWVLAIGGGAAEVRAGGRGELACDVRGLAPLYTGMLPPRALAALGWIEGSEAALATAGRAFAGPEPWMPDMF